MLKMALFDCAINEKCCSFDGGRGICPLSFRPTPGIGQLKSPHPREFALDGKFPGVWTFKLSNPPVWGRKRRANIPSSVNTATFSIDRTVE